jgi:hypothetical protein
MVSAACNVVAPVYDPLCYAVDLPLRSVLYPFGFPVEFLTNSRDVQLAVEESWGGYPQSFWEPPMEIRVVIDHADPDERATGLVWRAQKHLVSLLSDARNFAVCDLRGQFAYCWVTAATARDRSWMRSFYLDTMVNLLLWYRHFTGIHAGCVALDGRGVLLCGESGAGKSCLTYACARRGWTFISDESPCLLPGGGRTVAGKPRQIHFRETAFELFPELLGRPVAPNPVGKISFEVATAGVPGIQTAHHCEVHAVVLLRRIGSNPARLVELPAEEAFERLKADLPLFAEPAHEERLASLRNLVEVGAYELRYLDLDSAVNELEYMIRRGGSR